MSIEEIIEMLKEVETSGIIPFSRPHRRALRQAIALLKTHPDNQPNEPLTLEELPEMDGLPVWDAQFCVWGLVDVGLCCVITRVGDIDLNVAGAERRLYRRPPNEKTP